MASQTAASAGSTPSAQVVGNAFVHQYYHILHHSPELVHRFYHESSRLGRPDNEGNLSCVTTQIEINDKILSMDYGECRAEIKTVDAQDSLTGGVLVLVTGYLTGKDNVRREFTQSFFLAPQDKGYFVLNDMFRYMGDAEYNQHAAVQPLANGGVAPSLPVQCSPLLLEEAEVEEEDEEGVEEQGFTVKEEEVGEEMIEEEEVYNPSDVDEASPVVEEAPLAEVIDEPPASSQPPVPDSSITVTQEEAPKKSYASIVKVMKESVTPLSLPAHVPARPAPSNSERHPSPVSQTISSVEASVDSSAITDGGSLQDTEADGHSIYVKNLPLDATAAQLEEEFKRFGPIKANGIQVRSHKQQGFCFGFVEFEVASAVQSAIEASPVTINGRQAFVEEKRPTGSRVRAIKLDYNLQSYIGGNMKIYASGRGRFVLGRGSVFRNDGLRGRGGYGGGGGRGGYGRGDFGNRLDFGSRGGGRGGGPGRGGDVGYQRVDNRGRGNRPGPSSMNNAPQKNVVPHVPAPA